MSEESGTGRPAVAVALEYDMAKDAAPRVTASGRGVIAEKIIATARENGVAVEGNPLLAEALSGVAVDDHIPEELYRAVAEVIGFVLRAAGKLR
ncbi:MAG: flagellar biosynthesis protein [Xanthobacteraceae bacterium]|nr:MAG: flagellar biosynthesis protein [Xanthobacteraceae bacterium]